MSKSLGTVAVGMSGGVDSSYASYYLRQQGYAVVGVTMAVFGGDHSHAVGVGHACYGPSEQRDIEAAQQVCALLDIPHYTLDLKREYKEQVIDYFVREYLAGRTPNPCTRCNPVVKFGFLLEKAHRIGVSFDRFATGHYARVGLSEDGRRVVLRKGVDQNKDQSYFLYGLRSDLLPQLLFPLGDLYKHEVRRLAEEAKLPVARRPESQDFIEGGEYSGLFDKAHMRPGPIVDSSGKKLGTHRGVVNYTIGQRRGLGVTSPEPLYVLRVDAATNTVVVGVKQQLLSDTLIADSLNYPSIDPPEEPISVFAKIRYRHKESRATLVPLGQKQAKVVFEEPQLSITPGQSVVFYRKELLLGGGVIKERCDR
jgi:tRNA-specific 2-thiouridylase